MAIITRTYTFTDGTTAYGSQVESEIANIVNALNNLDAAGATWTNVKVTTLLPQADVNMGGHKITNLGTPGSSGDAAVYPITASQITAGTITNTQLATGAALANLGAVQFIWQQVQATGTTVSTSTSSTFASTVITASITPTSSSHKIKISVTTSWDYLGSSGLGHATIERGTTNLGGSDGFSTVGASGVSQNNQTLSMCYLDSPATTSATSYTVYIRNEDNSTQVRVGRSGTGTWVILLEEIG